MTERFDYIVVGAGSAGCVLANRLSADPRVRVLLVEAGPEPHSPWIAIPAGLPRLLGKSPLNWPDMTVRSSALEGGPIWMGHGRTLGGTSAINGMVYNRGVTADYDGWAESGCAGWGWEDVLRHFERIEADLRVTIPAAPHVADRAFIAAGAALGLGRLQDFNGPQQEGAGVFSMTIADGRRQSSHTAFLAPARARRNLVVRTGAQVERIMVADGRAVGITVTQDGAPITVAADREVLLCAGAIDSPRLLMLSGIGPAAHLAEHGIEVVLDLPGVGCNLQDHLIVGAQMASLPEASLNGSLAGPLSQLMHGIRYFLTRTGPATLGSSTSGAFARLAADDRRAQVQLSFRPFSVGRGARGNIAVERRPAVSGSATWLHPFSRGTIRLAAPNPAARPAIDPAYLSDPRDVTGTVAGLRLLASIFGTSPLRELLTEVQIPGGPDQSDAEVTQYVRATATSMCHPVGTCRMGTDAKAVVDPALRVRGIAGLRVVDASIMPDLPTGNTNAASMMIGDRAAAMIRSASSQASTFA